MVSVVVATGNSQATLPAALSALVPAAADGLLREVILVDHGSRDATARIGDAMGCEWLEGPAERGARLKLGAERAKSPVLLFLHADTVLEAGFEREVRHLLDQWLQRDGERAAVFRTLKEGHGARPRVAEWFGDLALAAGFAPGERGLLIPAPFYRALGGHRPLAVMEDIDIARRIGARRLVTLRSGAHAIAGEGEPEAPARAERRRRLVPWLFGIRAG